MKSAREIESLLIDAAEGAGDYQSPDFGPLWKAIAEARLAIEQRDAAFAEKVDQLCTAESKVGELDAENEALIAQGFKSPKVEYVDVTDEFIARHFRHREALLAIADFDEYSDAVEQRPDFDDDNRGAIALDVVRELAQNAVRPGDPSNIKEQREAKILANRRACAAIVFGEKYYDPELDAQVVRMHRDDDNGEDGLVWTRVVDPKRRVSVGYEGCSFAAKLKPWYADPLTPLRDEAGAMVVTTSPHGDKEWITEVTFADNGALTSMQTSPSKDAATKAHAETLAYWRAGRE